MVNQFFNLAKKKKADEFYTQLSDIEKELRHYKDQFNGKVVFCNCDDPYESNFFKYFATSFNHLKLKKLVATGYVGSPVAYQQLPLFDLKSIKESNYWAKRPYKIEISEVGDNNADGAFDLSDVKNLLQNKNNVLSMLEGDGDFRSPECIELLKQADIVVTNPPFSLFRDFVSQLIEFNKQFLIIGNQNAITYNEVFRFIKENKMWIGYDNGGTKWFQVPMDYDITTESRIKIENNVKYFSMGSIMWFTNLDVAKRHEKITLFRHYTPDDYPRYDNFDAINVDKVSDIPYDFYGIMGVPITFLDKYNPEQFEIVGNEKMLGIEKGRGYIKGKRLYGRVFIKRKGQ